MAFSLPIELQLDLNNNDIVTITTGVTIQKNELSGQTTVTLTETNYGDLSGTSTLLVGQLSEGYDYVVNGTVSFDIPIYSGSGSAGGDALSGGIGLELLN